MSLGLCDVSLESCNHILNEGKKAGGGRAICIVVGGAKEGAQLLLALLRCLDPGRSNTVA